MSQTSNSKNKVKNMTTRRPKESVKFFLNRVKVPLPSIATERAKEHMSECTKCCNAWPIFYHHHIDNGDSLEDISSAWLELKDSQRHLKTSEYLKQLKLQMKPLTKLRGTCGFSEYNAHLHRTQPEILKNVKFEGISPIASQMWKKLSKSGQDKFKKMSKERNQKVENDKKQLPRFKEYVRQEMIQKTKFRRNKRKASVKRAPNAFFLWRDGKWKEQKETCGMSRKQFVKVMGEKWRELGDDHPEKIEARKEAQKFKLERETKKKRIQANIDRQKKLSRTLNAKQGIDKQASN